MAVYSNFKSEPFDHFVIQDVFDAQELLAIQNDLQRLLKSGLLFDDIKGKQAALNQDGSSRNTALNAWLDDLYMRNRQNSQLIKSTESFIHDQLNNLIFQTNSYYYWAFYRRCNFHGTMLNYYKNSTSYLPHYDNSAISIIFTFFQEPMAFTGGDIRFTDFDYSIPAMNNSAVIFPGYATHCISEVTIDESKADDGLSRFGLVLFLSHVDGRSSV